MTEGHGTPDRALSETEIREILANSTPAALFAGKKILVLTPDTTRTCPLPLMIRCLGHLLGNSAARLDFMVALGTHTPLAEERILALYGISDEDRQERWADSRFLNHRWDLPDTLTRIGWIETEEIEELSGGRLSERVPVDINRAIFDYDLLLILGPVFPHEVVGYSGGAKYLFPGISGGEFLHAFHWLGAVVTCPGTIGIKDTPVREVINRAMRFVETPVHCLAMVVKSAGELYGLFGGDYRKAWSRAADLSEQVHVVVKEKPYPIAFGVCPPMYNEIWTGGKVMYKLEQVVADGGRLIIYAPHITEVSRTWAPIWRESATMSAIIFLPTRSVFRASRAGYWPTPPTSAGLAPCKAASRSRALRWCLPRQFRKKPAGKLISGTSIRRPSTRMTTATGRPRAFYLWRRRVRFSIACKTLSTERSYETLS